MIENMKIFKKPSFITKIFRDEESSILKTVSGIKIAEFFVQKIEGTTLICSEIIDGNAINEYKKIRRGAVVVLFQKDNPPLQGRVLEYIIYESHFEIHISYNAVNEQKPRNLIARIIL